MGVEGRGAVTLVITAAVGRYLRRGAENLPRAGRPRTVCLVCHSVTTTGGLGPLFGHSRGGVGGGGGTAENSRNLLFPKTRVLARHSVIVDLCVWRLRETKVSEGTSPTPRQAAGFGPVRGTGPAPHTPSPQMTEPHKCDARIRTTTYFIL